MLDWSNTFTKEALLCRTNETASTVEAMEVLDEERVAEKGSRERSSTQRTQILDHK